MEPVAAVVLEPLYKCSTCNKPFDQVHCRRRAARRQLPRRPRACTACSRSKMKCDFKAPCSRCVARKTSCSYGINHHAVGLGLAAADLAGSRPEGSVDALSAAMVVKEDAMATAAPTTREDEPSGLVGLGMGLDGQDLFLGAETTADSVFDQAAVEAAVESFLDWNDAAFNISAPAFANIEGRVSDGDGPSQATESTTEEFNLPLPNNSVRPPSFEPAKATVFRLGTRPQDRNHSALMSKLTPPATLTPEMARALVYRHDPLVSSTNPSVTPAFVERVGLGGGRLIVSMIRAYPRMMLRPHNLPPFIHPVGRGLHSRRDAPAGTAAAVDPAPLKPLAVCTDICRLFLARMANSVEFLWRTIDAEHVRLRDQVHMFSEGEVFAAIQSIIMYTIMHLIDHGTEYFVTNRSMLVTMKSLGKRLSHPKTQGKAEKQRLSRDDWGDWIFNETHRRIIVNCFLISLVVGSESCSLLVNPHAVLLPCSKALWEARSAHAWEEEYDAARVDELRRRTTVAGGHHHVLHKPWSVADLALANLGDGNDVVDDELDGWHAGLDGLGMILAAVVAGV